MTEINILVKGHIIGPERWNGRGYKRSTFRGYKRASSRGYNRCTARLCVLPYQWILEHPRTKYKSSPPENHRPSPNHALDSGFHLFPCRKWGRWKRPMDKCRFCTAQSWCFSRPKTKQMWFESCYILLRSFHILESTSSFERQKKHHYDFQL